MLRQIACVTCLVLAACFITVHLRAQLASDNAELTRLEQVWNSAHLNGDSSALERIWADDIEIAVPHMAVLSKNDALQFFRSGRFKFEKYETSDLHFRTYGNTAVVTGTLRRVRIVGGVEKTDHWRFTKTYIRSGDIWKVVSFHASDAE